MSEILNLINSNKLKIVNIPLPPELYASVLWVYTLRLAICVVDKVCVPNDTEVGLLSSFGWWLPLIFRCNKSQFCHLEVIECVR